MGVLIGKTEFFPGINKIQFEGRDSKNALAFKWYDQDYVVCGQDDERTFKICDGLLAHHAWFRRRSIRSGHPIFPLGRMPVAWISATVSAWMRRLSL